MILLNVTLPERGAVIAKSSDNIQEPGIISQSVYISKLLYSKPDQTGGVSLQPLIYCDREFESPSGVEGMLQ